MKAVETIEYITGTKEFIRRWPSYADEHKLTVMEAGDKGVLRVHLMHHSAYGSTPYKVTLLGEAAGTESFIDHRTDGDRFRDNWDPKRDKP